MSVDNSYYLKFWNQPELYYEHVWVKNYVSDNYTVMRFSNFLDVTQALYFIKESRRIDNTFRVGDKIEYLHISLYSDVDGLLVEIEAYEVYEIVESGAQMMSGNWDYTLEQVSLEHLGFTREELGLDLRST